ncbi:MAG: cupin domain-containing protein [Pseudomonadota bacterium]
MLNNYLKNYELKDLLKLPGEGDRTHVEARVMTRHSVCGMSLMEATVEVGALLPPHVHQHSHQAVYVISGELNFNLGGPSGMTFTAPAGSYVIKPKRVVHSFWNTGTVDSTYIELTDNDLFEGFIESRQPGRLFEGVAEMRADWGQYVEPEQTLALLKQHGLTKIAQAGYDLRDTSTLKTILADAPPELVDAFRDAFGEDRVNAALGL